MSTYRERREARAERLREWADGRESKSDAAIEASRAATAGIEFGQPILVGHHSERRHRAAVERGQRQATAAVEHARTADRHREKADNIEGQLATAIYSDDADAVEKLRERIAGMEEERERIKRYNASARKAAKSGGIGDLSILTPAERAEVESIARHSAYSLGAGAAMPGYKLTNLGGNISRLRKRLARLEAEQASPDERGSGRRMEARYGGTCADCGGTVEKGDLMTYYRRTREVVCGNCEGK